VECKAGTKRVSGTAEPPETRSDSKDSESRGSRKGDETGVSRSETLTYIGKPEGLDDRTHAPVAQWTEQRPSKPLAGGSNPPGRTRGHVGSVAQSVSAPGCGPGGCGFESRRSSSRASRTDEFVQARTRVGELSQAIRETVKSKQGTDREFHEMKLLRTLASPKGLTIVRMRP
jgi:hypothetical protein